MSAPATTPALRPVNGHAPRRPSRAEGKFPFLHPDRDDLGRITGVEVVLVYLPIVKWFVVTALVTLSCGEVHVRHLFLHAPALGQGILPIRFSSAVSFRHDVGAAAPVRLRGQQAGSAPPRWKFARVVTATRVLRRIP